MTTSFPSSKTIKRDWRVVDAAKQFGEQRIQSMDQPRGRARRRTQDQLPGKNGARLLISGPCNHPSAVDRPDPVRMQTLAQLETAVTGQTVGQACHTSDRQKSDLRCRDSILQSRRDVPEFMK